MKKIMLFALVIAAITACKNEVRYTQNSPEIETYKKAIKDYEMGNWESLATHFADTAKTLMPVGEFNVSKIVINNGHVEHWLNGAKVVEYQMWTPEWDSLKSVRKWKDFPLYGTARKGHIGLQDHGKQTWFRNIKIRTL